MHEAVIISHRGNLSGPEKDTENKPRTIDFAISHGLQVEIDVWGIDGQLFLGHDNPSTPIDIGFLLDRSNLLWIHCKNSGALAVLLDYSLNFFFHDTDYHVLTSKGFIWSRPGFYEFCKKEILVLPERVHNLKDTNWIPPGSNFHGICTDFPFEFLNSINLPITREA